MAVGRIGCLLTEQPGTPTGSALGHHPRRGRRGAHRLAGRRPAAPVVRLRDRLPPRSRSPCIWWWLRRRSLPPGETFVWYVAAYGVFRFLVEFVRGNDVAWAGLTRPQLFLLVTVPLVLARIVWQARRGAYRDAMTARSSDAAQERRDRMSGMPLRGDRIHRYVNAFCPVCHEERPDRPLAEVQRLSGWLVERDDRIWLERGCATHGLVRTLYDESPEILTLPRAVDGADQAPRARRPRQLQARARGVRRRPARDADPAHLHPARGPPRPLQPEVPDVLRRVLARPGVRRAAGAGAGVHRRPALAGERAHRRADALRRRADALPLAGRAARRRGRAADRAGAGQHQRPAGRPGRRAARPPRPGTASGSRSTCSTTASRPRRRPTTAAPTSAASRSGPSSGSRPPASSRRSP